MRNVSKLLMTVMMFAGLLAPWPAAGADTAAQPVCLQYGPQVVSLAGTIIYRTFADAMGRPERAPLLLLDEPICVDGVKESDESPSEGDQVIVHLNFHPDRFGSEQRLSGQRAVATGTLYHAHTVHHHAPLVLMVQQLNTATPNDRPAPTPGK